MRVPYSVTANAGHMRLLTSCNKTVGDHSFENFALVLFCPAGKSVLYAQ